jgi:hypothetical protein
VTMLTAQALGGRGVDFREIVLFEPLDELTLVDAFLPELMLS